MLIERHSVNREQEDEGNDADDGDHNTLQLKRLEKHLDTRESGHANMTTDQHSVCFLLLKYTRLFINKPTNTNKRKLKCKHERLHIIQIAHGCDQVVIIAHDRTKRVHVIGSPLLDLSLD